MLSPSWFVAQLTAHHLEPFRRYSRSKSEVVQNWQTFGMFWPQNFFGWSPANFGVGL